MTERVQKPLFLTEAASENRGLITFKEPTSIGNAFQSVQNIVFTKFGFGPREGYSLVGVNDNAGTTAIKSLFKYEVSNKASSTIKREVLIRSHTTWLEWFNDDGGVNGEWHTLVSGLTTTKRFGFASFNLTQLVTIDNRLYFGNGVENFSLWNGATTVLNGAVLAGAATITVDDTTLFTASGSILINGTTVTYTGKSSTTFTGCSGTPAASDNDGVAQLPDTTTYSARPKINYMLTAFSRIWGFGGDGDVHGNRLHYSQAGTSSAAPDPTDFTAAANLEDPGFRDFPEGGANLTSIEQLDDKIIVFKENVINTYTFDYSLATKFDIVGTVYQGPDVGCGALGATTHAIDRVFFVSKKGGLKELSREEGSHLLRPLQITERIQPTIKDFDFSNAAIHYDEEKNFILVSCASEADITNDTIICYDLQRDAITLFKGISAEVFETYKGKTHFGHAITSKVYKLFDGRTDGGSQINASATTAFYTFGDVGEPKALDMYYVEGYILNARDLNIRFDFDDNTQSYKQITINGDPDNDYIYAIQPNTFGEFEFGELPFGGDPDDLTGFHVFRVYIGFENTLAYNASVTFWSNGVGEQWYVKNYGFAPTEGDILPKNVLYI
ncbi:hypothetical protein HY469_00695 [Candidatus Roizmanbacteria bacterium]|nr:hypothetical protein [Candidatus Roizmanbacteria bacterium]